MVLTVVAPPVAGQAEEGTVVGRPSLALSAQDSELRVGERNVLEVLVANDGDIDRGGPAEFVERVTTARNVRLTVAEDRLDEQLARAVDVRTGTVLVGTVGQGVVGPFEVELDVAESLPPGEYEIPVRVTYDYTTFVEYGPGRNPTFGDASRTDVVFLTVVVEDRARFEVTPRPDQSIPAGTTGTVGLSVRNVGGEPARNARVRLSAEDSPLFFGESDSPQDTVTTLVPELGAGETTRVNVPVGTGRDTRPGTYPLVASVEYADRRGVTQQTPATEVAVAVQRRQSFAVAVSDAALQVGQEGSVTGTVRNTGDRRVDEAVLALEAVPAELAPQNVEVPLGALGPGENATFAYTLTVSNRTTAGPRQFGFRVRYRDEAGEQRTSDPLEATVAVAREQTFAVGNLTDDLRVGWTGTLAGTVVNTGDAPVSNATVVLRGSGEGVVPRATEFAVGDLAPGEPAPFEFTVDVSNRTDAGRRPVGFRVRYRDARGNRQASDRIDASVTVGSEQTFAVSDTSQSLRVGQRGTVRGVVTNTGETAVTDAVVVLDTAGTMQAADREFVVGNLAPGERAPFEFTVDVSNRSEAGPRQVSYRVRYRGEDGERRTSERLTAPVGVGPAPAFAVRNLTAALRVGQPGTVSGAVVNTGDAAVDDAVLQFAPGVSAIVPRTGEVALGTLEPGERVPFQFTVDVSNRTAPGTRPATFRVQYSDPADVTRRSDPLQHVLPVSREQTFAVTDVQSALRVGQRGTVSGRVVNTGPGNVSDASVALGASGDLRPTTSEIAVGDLAAGESVPFAFTVVVPNGSDANQRVFPFQVRYRAGFGETVVSDRIDASVGVGAEQTFALANLTDTLRVDWTGTVSGTVVNTGDAPVSGAVVQVAGDSLLRPRAREYAVGDLAPGERVPFEFTVDVPNGTVPGPRLLSFRVRYRAGTQVYVSDPVDGRVTVGPEREPFTVRPVNATVPVDGDSVLTVEVTNVVDEPLTDVRGQLGVAAPFETEDTSAFAGRLAPGESTRLRFDLSATNDAIPKNDSVQLSVSYTDARGDRRVTTPYVVPVTVVQPAASVPIVPTALGLLAVVGAAIWWWRRR